MGGRFLGVEVLERDIGVEEVDGISDSGGVSDGCPGFKDAGERGSFEEASEEEVPLQVGEREKLFRGRHREPKTGDIPSFIEKQKRSKGNLLLPSGYKGRNGVGRSELRASAKAFASGVVPGLLGIGLVSPSGVLPLVRRVLPVGAADRGRPCEQKFVGSSGNRK